jgi:hypothetical protein
VLRGVVNSLDRFSRTVPKGRGAPLDDPAADNGVSGDQDSDR